MAEMCTRCKWKAEAGTLHSGGGDLGMASWRRGAWTEPCGDNHSLGREGKGRVGTNDPQRPVAGCVRGCAGSVLVERELEHEGGGALLIFLIVKVMHGNCENKKRRSFRKI